MTEKSHDAEEAYIRSNGADPESDFIDPEIMKTMTPEGRDLAKRVMASTSLQIQMFDAKSLRRHRSDDTR